MITKKFSRRLLESRNVNVYYIHIATLEAMKRSLSHELCTPCPDWFFA
jgi:hypothetical protein